MKSMLLGSVAAWVLVATAPGTAFAAPQPVGDALAEIDAACAAGDAARLSLGGAIEDLVGDESGTRKVIEFDAASIIRSQWRSSRPVGAENPPSDQWFVNGVGTFERIDSQSPDPRNKRRALTYLNKPGARYWIRPNRYFSVGLGAYVVDAWAALRDTWLRVSPPCGDPAATSADRVVDSSGYTWTLERLRRRLHGAQRLAGGRAGRLIRSEILHVHPSGSVAQMSGSAYAYGAPAFTNVPTRQQAVTYKQWSKAYSAASINADLRNQARAVARDVNVNGPRSVAQIRQQMRALTEPPIRVRTVAGGALIHRTNPYTGTYHAWQVVLRSGRAAAIKVAP